MSTPEFQFADGTVIRAGDLYVDQGGGIRELCRVRRFRTPRALGYTVAVMDVLYREVDGGPVPLAHTETEMDVRALHTDRTGRFVRFTFAADRGHSHRDLPRCVDCGNERGPWVPTGERDERGAQLVRCAPGAGCQRDSRS